MNRIRTALVFALLFVASSALASWYDDYDAGLAAVRKGQWSVVVQKMSAAIAGNGKESDNARTYGNIFISYHPYYYRGLGYLRTGKYEQAVADFEKTGGPGELDRGSIDTLMGEAKQKLAAANTPEPQPAAPVPQPRVQPQTQVPVPVPQPAAPVMDPALRSRVQATLNAAQAALANARNRKAGSSPQYAQAVSTLTDANGRFATAKSNDDLNAALALASNASLLADNAVAPGEPAKPPVQVAHVPPPTRPVAASSIVLGDTTRRVRLALESYFRGDFDEAQSAFERLSTEMPKNGWIFAFLGASQYSRYAFETDEKYKTAAMESFRKAKSLHTFRNGLPQKYFSKRIRKVFDSAS